MPQATDFIFPVGKIEPSFFPDVADLGTVLQPWVDEATSKVATVDPGLQEAAAKDWVYYRAFDALANRLAMEPDQADADGVSQQISISRVEFFRKLAAEHKADFDTAAAQTSSQSGSKSDTRSVRTQVRW